MNRTVWERRFSVPFIHNPNFFTSFSGNRKSDQNALCKLTIPGQNKHFPIGTVLISLYVESINIKHRTYIFINLNIEYNIEYIYLITVQYSFMVGLLLALGYTIQSNSHTDFIPHSGVTRVTIAP